MLPCRVHVQLSIRADALRQQGLCVSQPLVQVVHVTVELPPLLYGAVETPAAPPGNTHTVKRKSRTSEMSQTATEDLEHQNHEHMKRRKHSPPINSPPDRKSKEKKDNVATGSDKKENYTPSVHSVGKNQPKSKGKATNSFPGKCITFQKDHAIDIKNVFKGRGHEKQKLILEFMDKAFKLAKCRICEKFFTRAIHFNAQNNYIQLNRGVYVAHLQSGCRRWCCISCITKSYNCDCKLHRINEMSKILTPIHVLDEISEACDVLVSGEYPWYDTIQTGHRHPFQSIPAVLQALQRYSQDQDPAELRQGKIKQYVVPQSDVFVKIYPYSII